MNLSSLIVLATTAFVSAGSAHAATTGDFVGTFSGNEECPAPGGGKTAVAQLSGFFCIAKFNLANHNSGEQGSNAALNGLSLLDNFTMTGAGTPSGTFTFDDQSEGIAISHLILKAGSQFSVYDLQGATSGDWMTGPHLANKQGVPHSISHLSFFGTTASQVPVPASLVPVPAALPMLLGALGGLAFMARRRTKE